jgi:hypothetical protein
MPLGIRGFSPCLGNGFLAAATGADYQNEQHKNRCNNRSLHNPLPYQQIYFYDAYPAIIVS